MLCLSIDRDDRKALASTPGAKCRGHLKEQVKEHAVVRAMSVLILKSFNIGGYHTIFHIIINVVTARPRICQGQNFPSYLICHPYRQFADKCPHISLIPQKSGQEVQKLDIPTGGATITNPDTGKAERPNAATHAPYEYLAEDIKLSQSTLFYVG